MIGVLRLQLEQLDNELVELLAKRMNLVEGIAVAKKESGIPVCVPEEEARKLAHLAMKAKEVEIDQELVCDVYASLMQHSRECQEKLMNQ